MEFAPKVDRGVNEERVSFCDPETQALEQAAIERVIMESAKYHNVTSVLKVQKFLPKERNF